VFDQISSKNRKSKRNILGLQILGILFSKNINPYSVESGVKEDGITEFDFYSAMADNIYNKNQLVFANAAEVCD
jgi:hypothetical protein